MYKIKKDNFVCKHITGYLHIDSLRLFNTLILESINAYRRAVISSTDHDFY